MDIQDRVVRALTAWVEAWGGGAVPLAGEHDHAFDLKFDPRLVAAIEAEFGWRPIASLPEPGPEFLLARTADGRVIYWRTDFLRAARNPGTPDHLQFPAVEWLEVPE